MSEENRGAGSSPADQPPPDPAPEPVPLEIPLEQQIGDLPPLVYPGDAQGDEFRRWAEAKRRRRIQTEIFGGAAIVIVGVVAAIVTRQLAFTYIALFGVAGLAAYEFLVASFE
jgi:hypothetical protein